MNNTPADSSPARQLALNMQLRDDATLESFLALSSQAPLLAALRQQLEPGGEPLLFLHGSGDTGKSHLLQAACHLAGNVGCYLPLADFGAYPPAEVMQGLEQMQLVCLDDIEAVLGDRDWELALFHFFNRARDQDCRLLISASAAPRLLDVGLADLHSRLCWGLVFQLPVPDDQRRQAILQFRAQRRGLQMPQEVSRFLVSRVPRGLASLLMLLDRLDAHSLATQRPLTIPFVKQVLSL
ncbi:DnaA regulatory inactivator Hda [Kineobactrum salinum]|uniref:DnaA regulatory inactivator Hda n=1 Tax=Kineobactrum salinum TaxID=2708301 RepID=A0A6C0U302_9GAMM|nr:DnaA regulatory inactivator Hda [Kineobactrum salinum]QIB66396.1 DnaA regulatory inactivator Hda [Kineobactrum salinum]